MATSTTTSLLAGDVMDRAAALLNDPAKTDFTYVAQLPYLNMAIDELVENLEESNSSPTNATVIIAVPAGITNIFPLEGSGGPASVYYPGDLVEIQEIGERLAGSNGPFTSMTRSEFLPDLQPSDLLRYWTWEAQRITFVRGGANTPREIKINYVRHSTALATSEHTVISSINARSFLGFKTAALCAMFIGENPTRAGVLNQEAERALERMQGINNKGRQQMVTRHRPFRAGWKARGGF